MDFHKFAIAGELLVIIACNRHQMNRDYSTSKPYVDDKFGIWIHLDSDSLSGFQNRNIDFLKYGIARQLLAYQLVISVKRLYVKRTRDLGSRL